MNLDAIHIFRISEESQNTRMYFDLEEKPDTEHNSVYMLRRSIGLGYATFSPPREYATVKTSHTLKIFTLTIFVPIFVNKTYRLTPFRTMINFIWVENIHYSDPS